MGNEGVSETRKRVEARTDSLIQLWSSVPEHRRGNQKAPRDSPARKALKKYRGSGKHTAGVGAPDIAGVARAIDGTNKMQNQPLNELASSSLSKTAAVMLLLACVAGCGSSGSETGDGGPNDARYSTGSSGGAAGAKSSTGGNGGAGGAAAAGSALAVNLRTAGDYVILAESDVSMVPPAVVTGNLAQDDAANRGFTADVALGLATGSRVIMWLISEAMRGGRRRSPIFDQVAGPFSNRHRPLSATIAPAREASRSSPAGGSTRDRAGR